MYSYIYIYTHTHTHTHTLLPGLLVLHTPLWSHTFSPQRTGLFHTHGPAAHIWHAFPAGALWSGNWSVSGYFWALTVPFHTVSGTGFHITLVSSFICGFRFLFCNSHFYGFCLCCVTLLISHVFVSGSCVAFIFHTCAVYIHDVVTPHVSITICVHYVSIVLSFQQIIWSSPIEVLRY